MTRCRPRYRNSVSYFKIDIGSLFVCYLSRQEHIARLFHARALKKSHDARKHFRKAQMR